MRKKITEDLFQAYYDARKNKRNKIDALEFEMDYERNLFELADEIFSGRYQPGPSICFIVNKPVKREIFAASFRDRVVHHLIYNYINPILEPRFIHDSYSCRLGKGTLYGIRRLDHFIRACSENYQKDCYILKLDIKGYFMSINRRILNKKVMNALKRGCERERERVSRFVLDKGPKGRYLPGGDIRASRDIVGGLIQETIFHNPVKNRVIKGSRADWAGLPRSKSLFFARANCGLPIGNLTSQLFGNVYLNEFDHFIKGGLGLKYFGRYVDDFVLVHRDKSYLKLIVPEIKDYLRRELGLELHEKKIYLQHFSKGVKFLGAVIKPYRIYIDKRTKGNFYKKIRECNRLLQAQENKLSPEQVQEIIAAANSYLGLLSHFRTSRLRYRLFNSFSVYWWNFAYIEYGIIKGRIVYTAL